jgi:lipopolysaccharide export system permease protein
MYILTRYVVAEVVKIFLITLTALTLIVTIVMGVKEGLGKGLPPMVMLHTMPYMLPEMLGITIPVSLLLAVSIVYGRMTGTNEIIALKSLGINPMAIVWPVIVFAFVLSLGTIWMQEVAATWCRPNYARVACESVEEIAYAMLRTNHSYASAQFSITVKRVEDKKLIQPTITIRGYGSNSSTTLRAAEAELQTDWQTKELNITCRNVEVDSQMRFSSPEELHLSIPIEDPGKPEHHRDWVAMAEIPDHLTQLNTEVWQIEQRRTALAAINQPLSPADSNRLSALWHLIYRLRTEPFRRLSNGFTCLCFVLIGVPVAMFWRHADVMTNFFVCFVPILAIYYPLLMLGEDLSTSGKLPPISFWMGNSVLILSGIMLLRRIVQH